MFTQLRYGLRVLAAGLPAGRQPVIPVDAPIPWVTPLPPFAARIITEPLGSLIVIPSGSTQRYRTATPGRRTRPEQ
jgi:hypothetical protein